MSDRTIPPPAIGWPLLPVPNEAGLMTFRTLEQSVRDQIRVILLTRPGEQLMRPDFGAGLENFVHENNTLETRRRIRDRIQDELSTWEPRIDIDRIDVLEVAGAASHLRVEIYYRVRRTGLPQQINLTVEVQS